MDKNTHQQMDQHVTILGWLYIITNAFLVVVGLCIMPLMVFSGLVSGDGEAFIITSIVGTFVAAFMFVLAIPGIIAGVGLLKRKSWARVLAIVLGILNLSNFPIGTAVGVYTLFVLLQSDASDVFATPKMA